LDADTTQRFALALCGQPIMLLRIWPLYVLRFLPTFADALLCGLTVRAAHSRPSNCAVMRLMTSMGFALASGVTFFPRASRPAALRHPAEG